MDFKNIWSTLTFANASGTRQDSLEVFGTAASDTFEVSDLNGGTVSIRDSSNFFTRGPFSVRIPGITSVTLHGLEGRDEFSVFGSAPFGISVDGGDASEGNVFSTGFDTAVTAKFLSDSLVQLTGTGYSDALRGIAVVHLGSIAPGTPGLTLQGTFADDRFDFTPTALGSGSFQVVASGGSPSTYPQFTYFGMQGPIIIQGSGGFNTLGLTATPGNDVIDAVQPDTTHLNFTLNAFTQVFEILNISAAEIDAGKGDDLIRVSLADSFQTAPAGNLRFTVDGGEPNATTG